MTTSVRCMRVRVSQRWQFGVA